MGKKWGKMAVLVAGAGKGILENTLFSQHLGTYSRKSICVELGRIPVVSGVEKKILHVFI